MRCFQAKRALSAYADGEIDDKRRTALEAHLAQCERCRRELAAIRAQWASLERAAPVPPLPPDLYRGIVDALDEAERLPWYRHHQVRLLQAACVAACAGFGFATGVIASWPEAVSWLDAPPRRVPEKRLVAEAFDVTAFDRGLPHGVFACDHE